MATRYPTGVRALLAAETASRRRIENRFVASLERAGYEEIVLPIIDYADPYASLLDPGAIRQSYRFVDREGELVAIRSDFTPMVARALATSIVPADLPLRLFYRGDVVRCESTRLGANREMFQIGAEIVGDGSAEADIETISIAASLLRTAGIEPIVVCNDTSLVDTLIDAILPGDDSPARRLVLRAAIAAKRSLRQLIDSRGEPFRLLERIGAGSIALAELEAYSPTASAARRLSAIATALDGKGVAIQLDDVDEDSGYYTGLRFRMYCGATRALAGQGGRYDSLYGRFGSAAPAAGFTITIDDILGFAREGVATDTLEVVA